MSGGFKKVPYTRCLAHKIWYHAWTEGAIRMKAKKRAYRPAKPRRRQLPSAKAKSQDTRNQNLSTYSEDGVDLTLIRWMLSLTPAQRLEVLQQHTNAILEIRHANPHL